MIFIMRRGGRGVPVVIIEAGYGWDGQRAKQQPEDHQNIRICSKNITSEIKTKWLDIQILNM